MDSEDEEFAMDDNLDEESFAYEEVVEVVEKSDATELKDDYQVLPTDKVAEEMENSVNEVSSVINIPKTLTRILLCHFKWDKEKLMEKYYDGDQDKLFADARVANPFKAPEITKSDECQVCFLEEPGMTGLQCGHQLCRECWDQYLKTKITGDGVADSISCAGFKCDLLVDDDTVRELLRNDSDRSRYQRLILNSFVESNRLFRWCPSPGCCYVIKAAAPKPRLIGCKCGHAFCFGCSESWHEPINCSQLKQWIKRCHDDTETMNWLSANTKTCPNCGAMIEKNGGCNRMYCRKCKYVFCWICMEAWSVHGYANPCNTFEPSNENKEKSRVALEKYLFYCNRYVSHQESLKLEGKMQAVMQKKMNDFINEHNLSWIDMTYLKNALDTLRSCRQTLSYTYVFAFYAEKTNQVHIFEDNQNDLQRAVESLSGYLEKDMDNDEFKNIKIKVLDKCRYCEQRRKTLIKHVQEGHEKNWWIFSS